MRLKSLLAVLFVSVISTMYSCADDPYEVPLTTIPTSSTQTAAPTATPAPIPTSDLNGYSYSTPEIPLKDLINTDRVSIGLNNLLRGDYISSLAERHNNYMLSTNILSHDNFNARSQNIINVLGAISVGENVAYNSSNVQTAFDAWFASPGHKANIEGAYTHFGILIRVNSATGRKYYTNIFARI